MTSTTERKKMPKSPANAVTVLTTSTGRFGARTHSAGIIIEGVPVGLADASWMETDPGKVREARRAGAAVVHYRA